MRLCQVTDSWSRVVEGSCLDSVNVGGGERWSAEVWLELSEHLCHKPCQLCFNAHVGSKLGH